MNPSFKRTLSKPPKQILSPIRLKSSLVIDQIKNLAESQQHWTPTWFVTKTFKFRTNLPNAMKQWHRYLKNLCDVTGAHIVPIAAILRDEDGRIHLHAALCLDRYVKYRSVHRQWRCGFSWDQLYRNGENAIPYILHGHDYIPVTKPYCPRKRKCRGPKGCRALNNDSWNIVKQAVEVIARDVPLVDVPSVANEFPNTKSRGHPM